MTRHMKFVPLLTCQFCFPTIPVCSPDFCSTTHSLPHKRFPSGTFHPLDAQGKPFESVLRFLPKKKEILRSLRFLVNTVAFKCLSIFFCTRNKFAMYHKRGPHNLWLCRSSTFAKVTRTCRRESSTERMLMPSENFYGFMYSTVRCNVHVFDNMDIFGQQ